MKSKIFYVIVFVMYLNIAEAQNEEEPGKNLPQNWDLSFSAGFTQNFNSDVAGPGVTYSIDINLPEKEAGLFVNFSYTDFNEDIKDQREVKYFYSTLNFVQIATGLRLYSGNSKSTFADVGMGLIDNGEVNCLSLTAGLGGKFNLSPAYSITLNGRFNAAFYNDPLYYFGLNAGIAVNGSIKPSDEFKKDKIALTAYAGTVGKGITDLSDGAFSAEVSYRMSDKVSLLMNFLYSYSHNESYDYGFDIIKDEKKTSLAAGARYFVTKNKVKLFLEGLTGIYTYDYTGRYYGYYVNINNVSDKYFGFTLGGGADIQLVDNLSGIIKFDQNILLGGEAYSGLAGGLKYSF